MKIYLPQGLIAFSLVTFFNVASYANSTDLTEELSLKIGLNQQDFVSVLDSRFQVAKGQLTSEKTWANPQFEISRDAVGNEVELGVSLQQEFDFSGTRNLNVRVAKENLKLVEATNNSQKYQRIAAIRRGFYQLLFQQQKQQLFNLWLDKFLVVEENMLRREVAGDVSGYDRLRISGEKIALQARLRQNQLQYKTSWQQLLGILGLANSQQFTTVDGQLLPQKLPKKLPRFLEEPQLTTNNSPELLQQQQEIEVLRLSSAAVASSRFPIVTLGVGIKSVESPLEKDYGLILSASVPLMVFDKKQGELQQSEAKLAMATSQYQLNLQQYQANLLSLWQKNVDSLQQVQLFKQQNIQTSQQLMQITEISYHANELGVLELVDAYQNTLNAELRALELTLESRFARIDLAEITGGIYQ